MLTRFQLSDSKGVKLWIFLLWVAMPVGVNYQFFFTFVCHLCVKCNTKLSRILVLVKMKWSIRFIIGIRQTISARGGECHESISDRIERSAL